MRCGAMGYGAILHVCRVFFFLRGGAVRRDAVEFTLCSSIQLIPVFVHPSCY